MTPGNRLEVTNAADLGREEERIRKKEALELLEASMLGRLEAGKFVQQGLPACRSRRWA